MRQLFTGFAAALVVLCTYGEAQAQLFKSNGQSKSEIERAKYLTPKPFEPNIAPFTEDDFINKPWLREFRYVFVINKANVGRTAQTIRVYDSGYLIYKDKVSTGREGFEMARASYFHKGPTKSYWSVTPVGYYQPKWLSKDHYSKSWRADMPFAMFYDLKNGLALHQANDEVLGSLGKRASGGCTRLSPRTAQDLFYRVQMTERTPVPVIQPNGQPERDAQGNIVYTTYFKSGGGTLPSYSALIIIHNVED